MDPKRRRLLEVLSEHLDRPVAELERMDRFEALDIDSLGLIDMITFVETAYAVRLPNEALEQMHSLTDLLAALEPKECENS